MTPPWLSAIPAGDPRPAGRDCQKRTCPYIIPAGSVDDPGLSIGALHVFELDNGLAIDVQPHVGLLKGYGAYKDDKGKAKTGVAIHALIEPCKAINDQLTAYLDVNLRTNTGDIAGDYLAIDLTPNVDCKVDDQIVANVDLSYGLAGDARQGSWDSKGKFKSDLGIGVAAILNMAK